MLKDLPDYLKQRIVMSRDPEGNGYAKLYEAYEAIDVGYDDNYPDPDWFAEDGGFEEKEWEELKADKSNRVILLTPDR